VHSEQKGLLFRAALFSSVYSQLTTSHCSLFTVH